MNLDAHAIWTAFFLTLFAGLSTGIGSAMSLIAKHTNKAFLSVALGFSAGVMIYVSFVEILPQSCKVLGGVMANKQANLIAVAAFFGGMFLIALIDKMVPSFENPHETKLIEDLQDPERDRKKLLRMGFLSALAIGIHNFPEGLATFTAALQDPALGTGIAIAIAIHNIPEGIAVAVPIYHATNSRRKAFTLSALSGFSEPVGAAIGFFLLRNYFTPTVFGIVFSAVGGIMVFISLDQLLPTAETYGKHHHAIYGLVAGMIVMAVSLLLFM